LLWRLGDAAASLSQAHVSNEVLLTLSRLDDQLSPGRFPVPLADTARGRWVSELFVSRPVATFIVLSALFGALTIALTPPLRGPDEPPHFLRTYGLLVGEIVPSITDERGRKGIFLPADLHRDIQLYEHALYPLYRHTDTTFTVVLQTYARLRAEAEVTQLASPPPVFGLYAGSEGYSPAPYLPYLPGLALARLLDLDFPSTIYLTRLVGFVILTAIMALAIALVPHLQWPFVLIGLLPSALFSRSVLGADAGSLAFAMMVTALALRGAHQLPTAGASMRSLGMTMCVLSKPPMLAFIVLELMRPVKRGSAAESLDMIDRGPRGRTVPAPLAWDWWRAAIVILPALILAAAWVAASSAEVAAWRLVEGSTVPLEHYQPLWKLRFLLDEPWHFFRLLAGTWRYLDDYALQLIGILGSLDMPLRPWVYPVLGAALIVAFCTPFDLDRRRRRRVAAIAGLSALGYVLAVFLIFYLVWTGLDQEQIEGVQGRYFVVALPLVAVIFAGILNRGLSQTARGRSAVLGSFLSGCATLDAVLRSDWKLALLPM
jgi:uncharacterized membrane protein